MSDTTEGKLKILTTAVEALIDSHPDKDAFRAIFMARMNNANINGGAELFKRIMASIATSSRGSDA